MVDQHERRAAEDGRPGNPRRQGRSRTPPGIFFSPATLPSQFINPAAE